MSATEREHVMPPRPLIPWTMALCAGMCMSCALVLNVAADALLKEQAPAVGPLWAIPVTAAAGSILCAACPFEAVAVCRVRRSRGGSGRLGVVGCGRAKCLEGARRSSGKQPRVCRAG